MARPKGSKNKPKPTVDLPSLTEASDASPSLISSDADASIPAIPATTPEPTPEITLAVYDPVNYPEGAARADAYLVEQEAIAQAAMAQAKVEDAKAQANVLPVDFKLPKKAQTIGQLFQGLEALKTPAEQIAWLRHNDKPVVRYLLRLAFDPQIEWDLPKGLPPYKPLQLRRGNKILAFRPGMAPTELFVEARRLYLFVKPSAIDRVKREKIFQNMLEDLEPIEVEVLQCIKDKKVDKFVTSEVASTAFPGILNGEFSPRFIRR